MTFHAKQKSAFLANSPYRYRAIRVPIALSTRILPPNSRNSPQFRRCPGSGVPYTPFNCWGVPQRHLFQPIVVPRES